MRRIASTPRKPPPNKRLQPTHPAAAFSQVRYHSRAGCAAEAQVRWAAENNVHAWKRKQDAIERDLSIRLPVAYRQAAEAGKLKRLMNADQTSVVAINRAFREGEFGDHDWPHHMFAFADDGGGNHFCLDLSSLSHHVLCRDHETLELVREADNFEAWLERC